MPKKEDLLEMIAIELGFKADNYYTAKENMFKASKGDAPGGFF